MTTHKRTIALGLLGAALMLTSVVLFIGGTNALVNHATSSSPLATSVNNTTTNYFNFSGPNHPKWNQGDLCTLQTNGSDVSCTYSGGSYYHGWAPDVTTACGCQGKQALIENISGQNLTITVTVSNLPRNVGLYLNFQGKYDVVNLNIAGCRGGVVNITLITQDMTLNLNYTASHVQSNIYFYTDHDHFNAVVSGNMDHTTTYFSGAAPRFDLCPYGNASKSDSYSLTTTGWGDSQTIVDVNAVGYNTPLNTLWTSHWNVVSFENTTNFGCMWSIPPASTCHHGGWAPVEQIAVSRHL